MAFDYEIVAYEGFPRRGASRGNRYGVKHTWRGDAILPRPNRAHGLKLIFTDQDNPRNTKQFWIYTLQRYNKWAQWFVHIAAAAAMYGLALEDETIPPDPVAEGE